jgi:hypothetical protein
MHDCRSPDMGKLSAVEANTVKGGEPYPGWTVNYK